MRNLLIPILAYMLDWLSAGSSKERGGLGKHPLLFVGGGEIEARMWVSGIDLQLHDCAVGLSGEDEDRSAVRGD
jgi:hypothetical protein